MYLNLSAQFEGILDAVCSMIIHMYMWNHYSGHKNGNSDKEFTVMISS